MITLDIVTICFNSEKFLPRCLQSIRENRSFFNHYIVIDGGSSDGTLNLLKTNQDIITSWISETDEGISDAFNKGILRSKSDYILLLNSDDWLIEENLNDIVELINQNDDIIMTKMASFSKGVFQGYFTSKLGNMSHRNTMLHPGCIVSKRAYEMVGLYNTSFQVAMDYEFFARCCNHDNLSYKKIDIPLVAFREGGVSRQKQRKLFTESFSIRKKFFDARLPVWEVRRHISRMIGDILSRVGLKGITASLLRSMKR